MMRSSAILRSISAGSSAANIAAGIGNGMPGCAPGAPAARAPAGAANPGIAMPSGFHIRCMNSSASCGENGNLRRALRIAAGLVGDRPPWGLRENAVCYYALLLWRSPAHPCLPRLAGIVGEAHVLTAPADVEPFVADWRGRYRGEARAVVLPASTDEVPPSSARAPKRATPIVPQGGNTGLCGGAVPDDARRRGRRRAAAHESRARGRRRERHDHRRGRRAAGRAARRRRRGRHALSAVARLGRQLHDRRQPVHQRRRHGRASLRQHARARAGHRGRARRWQRASGAARPAQGQHGLRPEAALHRRRRHARHRHRGGDEALPGRRARRPPRSSRCLRSSARSRFCRVLQGTLSDRLSASRS